MSWLHNIIKVLSGKRLVTKKNGEKVWMNRREYNNYCELLSFDLPKKEKRYKRRERFVVDKETLEVKKVVIYDLQEKPLIALRGEIFTKKVIAISVSMTEAKIRGVKCPVSFSDPDIDEVIL